MKKIWKFLILTIAILGVSLYSSSVFASFDVQPSGKCGDNLTWVLWPNKLVIKGTGDMYDYDSNGAPWAEYYNYITNVEIDEGVTSIGNYAFYKTWYVTNIDISSTVTKIGSNALSNCSRLTSVVFPDAIEEIGYNAFYGCNNLSGNIVLPDSLATMGGGVFGYCENISSVVIGDGLNRIESQSFFNCKNLTNITMGSNVNYIEEYAFDGCDNLSNVHINSISSWCETTFDGYDSNPMDYAKNIYYHNELITNLDIPVGTTFIGKGFKHCTSITKVNIPGSVKTISTSAFSGCTNIEEITINEGVENIEDSAFAGTGITQIHIPSTVLNIGKYAFKNCENLSQINVDSDNPYYCTESGILYNKSKTSIIFVSPKISGTVEIPNTVTKLEYPAFAGCTNLEEVIIPSSVTSIGSSVFSGCTNLKKLTIPFLGETKNDTTDNYLGYLFSADDYSENSTYVPASLKSIILTDATTIGEYAFAGCNNIETIVIPNTVTSIGMYSLKDCENLVNLTIPFVGTNYNGESDHHLAALFGNYKYSYSTCSYEFPSTLRNVVITGSVNSIGSYAFACSNIESITIPKGVTSIGEYAFRYCDNLESVYIDDITGWCKIAFYHTESNPLYYASKLYVNNELLTKLEIPQDVYGIKPYAFYNYSYLVSVSLHENVTQIGTEAFNGCCKLVEIHNGSLLPITKGSRENGYIGYYAINIYDNLETPSNITIDNDFAFYKNGDMGYIIGYTGSEQDMVIPYSEEYDNIYDYAFMNLDISCVTIPSSIKVIGNSAFLNCTNIKKVNIQDLEAWCNIEFKDILSNPIYYSKSLFVMDELATDITIPASVKKINNFTFYNCLSLSNICLPETLESIGKSAFYGCSNLKTITLHNKLSNIGTYAFSYCSNLENINFNGSKSQWQKLNKEYSWDYNTGVNTTNGSYKINIIYTEVDSVSLNKTSISLLIGETESLVVSTLPDNATDKDVAWTSSNSDVVSVENGVLTATGIGQAIITVTNKVDNSKTDTCTVTVLQPVTGIMLNKSSISLLVGKSEIITASVLPNTASNKTVMWSSSNPNIATVENGNVIAVSSGTATITAITADGSFSEICTVNVFEGVNVSGSITSFGENTKEVLIELLQNDQVVLSKTVTGNISSYSFEKVESGSYMLRVSKSKHCTREYTVVVSDSDVTLNVEIWLYGDVNADGTVNHIDVLQINRNIASQTSVFDAGADELKAYRFKVANVTAINGSDTELNHIDVLQINRKIANLTSIFDSLQ